MDKGWIKIHRKLMDNPIYKRPAWLSVWLTILLLANHEVRKAIVNGKEVEIKRGHLLTGRKSLSEQTGVPESTVEDVLRYLENSCQIRQQKTTKYRLIEVLKWDEYQESDSKPTANRQQSNTHKNEETLKNGRRREDKDIAPDGADDPKKLSESDPMTLEEFVSSLRKSPQRHMNILAEYADEIKPKLTTRGQWRAFIARNVRAARQLAPFSDEQMSDAMHKISKNIRGPNNPRGFMSEWTLETLVKYVTK